MIVAVLHPSSLLPLVGLRLASGEHGREGGGFLLGVHHLLELVAGCGVGEKGCCRVGERVGLNVGDKVGVSR